MRSWSERLDHAASQIDRSSPSGAADRWLVIRRLRTAADNTPLDAWGTPLAIHATRSGFEIRSSGSDRRFDSTILGGEAASTEADIVWIDGYFAQFPANAGISLPDGRRVPQGLRDAFVTNCRACHRAGSVPGI
jgi:hypothetical protein